LFHLPDPSVAKNGRERNEIRASRAFNSMQIRTTRFDIHTCDGISYEDITPRIQRYLDLNRVFDGVCILTLASDECALTLSEDSEEEDDHDLIRLARDHLTGPAGGARDKTGDQIDEMSDAGFVASVPAVTLSVPVSRGMLAGGSWERILLVDPHGPATRSVDVTLLGR